MDSSLFFLIAFLIFFIYFIKTKPTESFVNNCYTSDNKVKNTHECTTLNNDILNKCYEYNCPDNTNIKTKISCIQKNCLNKYDIDKTNVATFNTFNQFDPSINNYNNYKNI